MPSSLDTNLVSFWKLNELTGTRVDSTGNHNLTDHSVDSAAGKIGNAALIVTGAGHYLSVAHHADFDGGAEVDLTVAGWLLFDSIDNYRFVLAKDDNGSNRQWGIYYDPTTSRIKFYVKDTAGTFHEVAADTLGPPSTVTWYYVVGWHDAVLDTINIQVNNGGINSVANTLGILVGTAEVRLGSYGGNAFEMSGMIDEWAVWRRVLTSGERATLYNSGNGITYPFPSTGFNRRAASALMGSI